MKAFTYTCPFCSRIATITGENYASLWSSFTIGNLHGQQHVLWTAVSCPHPDCREYSFSVALHDSQFIQGVGGRPVMPAKSEWQLVPNGMHRTFPDYIPAEIRRDYTEACLIRELSPKASATLSRRCLQGMLRDFWTATRRTLYDEIESVKPLLDTEAWGAIHAVRELGNIGAHMKADVNAIVDVDPGEAEALTDLIELLFEDWYITRQQRTERMAKVRTIAASKKIPDAS